eukprot:scaffold4204_cov329-Prasinococcus_capsulatus_cf.AAC.2
MHREAACATLLLATPPAPQGSSSWSREDDYPSGAQEGADSFHAMCALRRLRPVPEAALISSFYAPEMPPPPRPGAAAWRPTPSPGAGLAVGAARAPTSEGKESYRVKWGVSYKRV